MELNLNRLDRVLFLFGSILPIGNNEKQLQLQKSMNMNISIDQAISILMRAIHSMIKENPEAGAGYLDFIKEAIDYVFENREDLPEIDSTDEILKTKMLVYEKTKKEYEI